MAKFLQSPDPAPKTFVFGDLNFDTASNSLAPASDPTISSLVAILKGYPSARVRIIGYTDNQGDSGANVRLSETRANVVKQALIGGGIDAGRITTAGLGSSDPIADNGTPEGRAKNRRTELEITSK
jgi:OmpA-OmpF porin, OOP family